MNGNTPNAERANANEIVKQLRYMTTKCDRTNIGCQWGAVLIDGANLIQSLTTQLAESQRRERAAVRDILCRDHCDVCKFSRDGVEDCEKYDFDCLKCQSIKCVCRNCRNEDKWEWRGPQEAGKGE